MGGEVITMVSEGPLSFHPTFRGEVDELHAQLSAADPAELVRWECTNCVITATVEVMLAWVTLARLDEVPTGSSSVVERRSEMPEVAARQTRTSGSNPASPTAPPPSPQARMPRRWGFTLGERLGRAECPYARRWIVQTPAGSLRLHRWYHSDDERAMHDHPWWFVTLVLQGGYTDCAEHASDHLTRGSVRYRSALHRHYVVPDQGGATTLLVTGPTTRRWGFWMKGRFRKSTRYFFDHGHPPCKETR